MCNSLKFENTASKIGDLVKYIPKYHSYDTKEATWSGFIRHEKRYSRFWSRATGNEIYVLADSIEEQKFHLCVGGKIVGLEITQDVHIEGKLIASKGSIRILTRAPENGFESDIHSRWPCIVTDKYANFSLRVFTQEDIINSPHQYQLV